MTRMNLLVAGLFGSGTLSMTLLAGCSHAAPEFGPEHSVAAAERPTLFGGTQSDRFGLQAMGAARVDAGGSMGQGGQSGQGGGPQGGAGAADSFEGEVPADWQKLPPSQFRQLNYRVGGSPDAECYLTAGGLGGGVLANVNRWVNKQFGEEPLTQAQFDALPRFALLGQPALLVTVEGSFQGMGGTPRDNWKLLGLVGGGDEDMVTLKFTGPREVVDAHRDAFLAFAASLHRHAATAGAPTAASPAALAGFEATTPAGWQVVPPSEFRQLNWRVVGSPDAECYFTAGNLRGGVLANVNRWVNMQFGQEPLTAAQFAQLPRHPLLGQPAVLVSVEGPFQGMGGVAHDNWKLLGLVGGGDDDMVTLKMTGPREVVDSQRDAFLQLAASIQRGAGSAAPVVGAGGPGGTPPGGALPGGALPGGATPGGSNPHGGGDLPMPPTPPADGNHGGAAAAFAATIPAGWSAMGDTGSRQLRHRFGTQGECYLGQLGGDCNQMLGIWCSEMSAPTPDAAGIAALPKVTMLGTDGVLLDLVGNYQSMGGQTMANARSLVAVVQQDGAILFAKCLGPAAEVESQRAAFLEFVKTLRRAQ